MIITKILDNLFKRTPKDLGIKGENLAVKYLKKHGYKILERNFRLRSGEVDIVAQDGNELVFVEVKTRSSPDKEYLMGAVNKSKERRIAKAASCYIAKENYREMAGRFDVVLIIANNNTIDIDHIKNAFDLE